LKGLLVLIVLYGFGHGDNDAEELPRKANYTVSLFGPRALFELTGSELV
jgi:hypothetical protein